MSSCYSGCGLDGGSVSLGVGFEISKERLGQAVVVPALRKQRQADLCEFKSSLILLSEFQDRLQSYTEKFCLDKKDPPTHTHSLLSG